MSYRDIVNDLPEYRIWAPTAFDCAGLGLRARQGWRVVITRTRDSGCVARSNFEAMSALLSDISPEGKGWEVHRMGHWGPGWVEVLLVNPNQKNLCEEVGHALARLEDHPVLDGDVLAELETEVISENWRWYRERFRADLAAYLQLQPSTSEWLSEKGVDLWPLYERHADDTIVTDEDDVLFDDDAAAHVTRAELAALIRAARRAS